MAKRNGCIRKQILPILIAIFLIANFGQSRAASADPTGVSNVLIPLAIPFLPFIFLAGGAGSSDDHAANRASKEAESILLSYKNDGIYSEGIYANNIPINYVVDYLFSRLNVSYVEIDAGASKGLNELSDKNGKPIDFVTDKPFVKISLADSSDLECVVFGGAESSGHWLRKPPIHPNTCLKLTAVDTVSSAIGIFLNTKHVGKKVLYWELKKLADNSTIISLPYWRAYDGKVIAIPQNTNGDIFLELASKVTFINNSRSSDGVPTALEWSSVRNKSTQTARTIETLPPASSEIREVKDISFERTDKGSWNDVFSRAYKEGRPATFERDLIVVPYKHQVFKNICKNIHGVIAAGKEGYYSTGDGKFEKSSLMLMLYGGSYSGAPCWKVFISTAKFPEFCANDFSCVFKPQYATVTDTDFVLIGRFDYSPKGLYFDKFTEVKYEWRIPLHEMPPFN